MQRRFVRFSAVMIAVAVSLLTLPGTSSAAVKDFLGRWDITLADTGDTFFSSWLEVIESDGKLSGNLLWKWGSVTDVKSVEVVDGELRVTRTESYEDKPVDVVYRARLADGKLVGSVKRPDGAVRQFTGVRSVEKVHVSGTWELAEGVREKIYRFDAGKWVPAAEGQPISPVLVLKQQGAEVSGEYITRPPKVALPVRHGKLVGSKLSLSVTHDPPRFTVHYSGEVRGDKIAGTAQAEGQEALMPFTAQRQRKWGEPIQLFNGKDLVGWRPRDPNRGFHWSVKDGVLVNRPPDQDIISEKTFQDFKLHVEFNMGRRSNSGIYLRGRYEMQLLDDFGRRPGPHSNCAIYSRLAPSVNASKAAGEWQALEATLVGRWLTVVLNGQTVLDNVHLDGITGGALDPNESEAGPLTFQGDHGLVRFRKIAVQPALD